MFVKRFFITITILLITVLQTTICLATVTSSLVQVYSHDNNMDVFISGDIDINHARAKIANCESEIIDGGLLTDKGITVRTTLLIDISTSIPVEARADVLSYIKTSIANIGKNEEIRITTFGERTTILQDFTNDRYDLMLAADIAFDNGQSMVYDAIYNTIPELFTINGEACYYQTIVITDGVDETNTGITKEELLIKLQNDTYPIHIIMVSRKKIESQDKDLAALARISGGSYGNIFPECDITKLANTFSTDGICWLRIDIPGNLLDGSTRQVDIYDNVNSIQFDTKLPVFDVPNFDSEPEDTTQIENYGTENNEAETVPTDADSFKYKTVFITTGAGIVVIIIVVLIIMLVSKRKKKETAGMVTHDVSNSYNHSTNDETVFIRPDVIPMTNNMHIILKAFSGTGQKWNLSLSEELLVGRDTDCQIRILDNKTSRKQCRIYYLGAVYIENLSQSNLTELNGSVLRKPEILKSGDKIKCGQVSLLVEKITESNDWEKNNGDTVYMKW